MSVNTQSMTTDEKLALLKSLQSDETLKAQIREQRLVANRPKKYAAFEPEYSQYRHQQSIVKGGKENLKKLLLALRAKGFGKKPAKTGKKK